MLPNVSVPNKLTVLLYLLVLLSCSHKNLNRKFYWSKVHVKCFLLSCAVAKHCWNFYSCCFFLNHAIESWPLSCGFRIWLVFWFSKKESTLKYAPFGKALQTDLETSNLPAWVKVVSIHCSISLPVEQTSISKPSQILL